jgi:hypothetical protein
LARVRVGGTMTAATGAPGGDDMRVHFDDVVHVHYGFLGVEPEDPADDLLTRSRAGQRNGLCGAAVPGRLSMVTGLHTGAVAVRVESHAGAPPIGPEWQDVVEVSVELADEQYLLTAFDGGDDLDLPAAGAYRARWCASGMDDGRDMDTAVDDGSAPDRYLLQLWPAPMQADVVVRLGSAQAAYWHGIAATTPPPPSPAELAGAAAQRAAREADEVHRRRVVEEAAEWGGRPPSERQRSWGWRAAMLARQDRALVDELAALTPDQLRTVATWSAGRACELAGLRDHVLVVEALSLLARGVPLPPVWKDWDALWDAFVPPEPGDVVTIVVIAEVDADGRMPVRPPLAPEAAAIDAVTGAAKRRPGKAAVAAIAGLSSGADDLARCFADVRDMLRTLPPA